MKLLRTALCTIGIFLSFSAHSQSPQYTIVIDKSYHELRVYLDNSLYKKYHVVFGNDDLSDKMYEGDRRTPEGSFQVIQKKISKLWGPELMLDYPTEDSYEKFYRRKDSGLIPINATIGGGIAIHGTVVSSNENLIDRNINWTNGCISLKLKEMISLYKYIGVGTKVLIKP